MDSNVVLEIAKKEDWKKFDFNVIVDPMVFRSADLFLAGRSDASQQDKNPQEVWAALSQNVGSLVAFFNAIVLNDKLPIIDYESTFGQNLGFSPFKLVNYCNQEDDKVLYKVNVIDHAYNEAKRAAIAELTRLRMDRWETEETLIAEIKKEMSAFQYTWQPQLPDLVPTKPDEEKLLRFMFGQTLFSAYAQMTGSSHLVQQKRSRLYLAASLGSAGHMDESELFDELKKIVNEAAGPEFSFLREIDEPAILPLLLNQDPETPADLLKKALELRKTDEASEYRRWRAGLVDDWRVKGRINIKNEVEIKRITKALVRKLDGGEDPTYDINMSLTGISYKMNLKRLYGWIMKEMPGHRYSKLLMRMMLSAHEYKKLDRHIETLWNKS